MADKTEQFTDKGMAQVDKLALQVDAVADGILNTFFVKFGTYQPGWAPLSGYTQADRQQQGYPDNEPLLRSGKTRDAFVKETEVTKDSFRITVGIRTGTIETLPYDPRPKDIGQEMCWHELGTSNEPPRPLLPIVADEVSQMLTKAFEGKVEFTSMGGIR